MYAGAKFPTVLEQRLAACKVMLVLIGPSWLNAVDEEGRRRLDSPDDWVRMEVATALKRGITVIPVRVAGAELPRKSSLPADMQGLLDHQATTVSTEGFRHQMVGLARDIRKISARRHERIGLSLSVLSVLATILAGLWVHRERITNLDLWNWSDASEGGYPVLDVGRDWVLYALNSDSRPQYFKPNSIKPFTDRTAVTTRHSVDPSEPVANNRRLWT